MAEITTDVFAIGKWNGLEFSLRDLQAIASNFKTLFDIHKPPVKIGHNDEQPLVDGQPALGWVEDLWVEGTQLMAKLVDVPDIVARAIKKKLYRKVSIELDFGVDHPRGKFDMVLSAIALLGADIPAVSTLSDLDAFMSRCQFSASRHASFSAIAGNASEELDMDTQKALEQLTARFDKLQEQLTEANSKLATAQAENADLKKQVETFAAADKARTEEEAKQKIVLARTNITTMLEDAVKDERITPAQREKYSRMLGVDDDAKVTGIDVKALEELLGEKKVDFRRGNYNARQSGNTGEEDMTPSQIVAKRTQEFLDTHKDATFSTAMNRVLSADVKLAEAYKYASDRKEG